MQVFCGNKTAPLGKIGHPRLYSTLAAIWRAMRFTERLPLTKRLARRPGMMPHALVAALAAVIALLVPTATARTIHMLGGSIQAEIPDGAHVHDNTIFFRPGAGVTPSITVSRSPGKLLPFASGMLAELRGQNGNVYLDRFFSGRKAWAIVYSQAVERRLYVYAYAYQTTKGVVLVSAIATRSQWAGSFGAMLLAVLSNMVVFTS
jgi:hypothetical protein